MSTRRRGFLGFMVAAAAAALGAVRARASTRPALRPPTALPEPEFLSRCIRCFRCGEACPPRCITFDGTGGLATVDTPFIHPTERGCTLCMKCGDACPTGALRKMSAALSDVEVQVDMGTPELDKQACLAWSRTGVCRLCFYVCPLEGKAITVTGPMLGPVFHEACVGCGLCAEACPQTVKAIRIVPRDGTRPS